ncbi:hypothetical protein ACFL35_07335 [Candidatus Riflebacteria bacterium]
MKEKVKCPNCLKINEFECSTQAKCPSCNFFFYVSIEGKIAMHSPDSPERTLIWLTLAIWLLVPIRVWIWVDIPIPDSLFIIIFWAPFWVLPCVFVMNILSNGCIGDHYAAEQPISFYVLVAFLIITILQAIGVTFIQFAIN